ncbi:hypothetical protein ACGFI9_12090 [Micromonospora sp. NPDC048930]|uniref:hypothetical protein n=1 Tax=Micromonospora sp. NPDC048930 TaxID=3364261 RepID=UPI0037133A79
MTRAPANLLAARRLLLDHLDIHENSTAYPTDLDPAEVGIVGDASHRGGYHCGEDRVDSDDYSVDESQRDRDGLCDFASALDVGYFRVTTPKGSFDLPHYSRWLVAQCAAGTPDTRDIREVIYSPDGKVVRRWDRLGIRSSGDSSHLGHTHESYFRDATKAGRDLTAVKRRYLTTIGLINGGITMADAESLSRQIEELRRALVAMAVEPGNANAFWLRTLADQDDALIKQVWGRGGAVPGLKQLGAQLAAVRADLAAMAGRDLVDEQQLAAQLAPALLAVLTPQAIAEAIPPQLAKDVADELAGRMVD